MHAFIISYADKLHTWWRKRSVPREPLFSSVVHDELRNVFICAGTDAKAESWSWAQYLDEQKAVAAPAKLFQEVQTVSLEM